MHTINLQIDLSSLDKIGLLKAFLEKLPFVKAIRFWENETDYLLSNPVNKERLLESLAQADSGEILEL